MLGCMPGCMSGGMLGRVPGLVSGGMLGRVPGLVSGCMSGRVLSFAPDVERMVSLPLAKGVNMSSLLYIFSTLQPQTKVYHFRGYPIPSHKFCGGGGRLLYWATSRCCKCQSSCAQLPRSGALLGSFFPMVLRATRHRCSAWQFLPDGALRRPCHYAAVPSASLPRHPGNFAAALRPATNLIRRARPVSSLLRPG